MVGRADGEADANGWSYKLRKPEDFGRAAEAVVKRGFSAIKYDPVPGPWRTFIPKDHIRHAVKVMRAVRGHYFLPALGW